MLLTLLLSFAVDSLQIKESTIVSDRVSKEVPAQVLQGSQLQSLSTASVADALKFFAGVQIKDYGGLGGQKTVNVRSLGTQHTGVYIDGIRITNCQNGTVDLSKYSLTNMEMVELYNANKISSLMSASEYASASTVYFTTKQPVKTSSSATYKYGSFNTHKASVHFDYKKYLSLDAEAGHSDGNYKFHYKSQYEDTTGNRHNSDISYLRSELSGFYKNLKLHSYIYYSDRGLPGGIVKRLSDKYQDVGREDDLNTFTQLSYVKQFDHLSVKYNGRYAYDKLHFNTDFLENQFVRYNNYYIQQDIYNAYAIAYQSGILTISNSSDLRWSDLSCNVTGMSYVYRLDFKSVLSAILNTEHFSMSGSLLYTNVRDKSSMKTASPLNRLTPSVQMSFKWNKFSLRSFYKSIFRAPTLNDLYYTQVGRRNLKPEYTTQYDIGLTYKNDFLDAQIDYYQNDVKDKIICVPQGGAYQWRMLNRGFVSTNGIDLSLRFTYKWFSLFNAATYQSVRDWTDPNDGSYGRQLIYNPKFSNSTILSFSYKNLSGSVSHMFCSKRYWSYASDEDVLPKYNCTDLKIGYSLWKCTLTFECDNIFNNYYELIQRWPLPARRYYFTLKINL